MSAPEAGKVVVDAPHGTLTGFVSWGCHCMWCLFAKRAATPTLSGVTRESRGSAGKPSL
ncbi:MAG: hypothetical protein ACRDTD_11875 [Pseudonocardiaceae bacterium]